MFLGCSDRDFHVPASSVEEAGRILTAQGASIDLRLYPGMGHTINEEELAAVTALLERLRAG